MAQKKRGRGKGERGRERGGGEREREREGGRERERKRKKGEQTDINTATKKVKQTRGKRTDFYEGAKSLVVFLIEDVLNLHHVHLTPRHHHPDQCVIICA